MCSGTLLKVGGFVWTKGEVQGVFVGKEVSTGAVEKEIAHHTNKKKVHFRVAVTD